MTHTSKQACSGWIKPVPSTLTPRHDLDHRCQAPLLFNHNHSLRWLNYWASVCSHNASLKGSTDSFFSLSKTPPLLHSTYRFFFLKCHLIAWQKRQNYAVKEAGACFRRRTASLPLSSPDTFAAHAVKDSCLGCRRQMDWGKDMQIFTGSGRPRQVLPDFCSPLSPIFCTASTCWCSVTLARRAGPPCTGLATLSGTRQVAGTAWARRTRPAARGWMPVGTQLTDVLPARLTQVQTHGCMNGLVRTVLESEHPNVK